MLATQPIVEQLTEIYFKEEDWHSSKMSPELALLYHQDRLDNGNIGVYVENGEVLGYFERYLIGTTCFLHNVYIKPEYRFSRVYKAIKKMFFASFPKDIKYIYGEKQKLGGKIMMEVIHGKH